MSTYEEGFQDGVASAAKFISRMADDIKLVEDKETEEVVFLRQLSDAVKDVFTNG